MKEQFDKELRDHIKDTFDVYNDLMEDDGWLKFEKKIKRKKRKAIFMWSLPGGIAAALALIWLLNIESFNDVSDNNKVEIVTNKPSLELDKSNTPTNIKDIRSSGAKVSDEKAVSEKTIVLTSEGNQNSVSTEIAYISNTTTVISEKNELSDTNRFAENTTSPSIINGVSADLPETGFTPAKPEFSAASPEEKKSSYSQKETGFNNAFSDVALKAYADRGKEETDKKSNTNKLKVGLDASTFMNFTKDGLSQDMNLGVGLVSEYKISKNFSINSGININKQSASYTAANSSDLRESSKNAAPFSGLVAMAAPVVNQESSSAKLIGFDIPFAIKYSSNNKNFNWFLSTGFSSYTLLSETYSDNITVMNYGFNGIQTTNEVITEEHKDGLFSNLQLARTLNFSVGIQVPIKNVTSLSVEPFIKYPLKSFGREDLTIGSSGVSLKMNLDKRLFK